MKYRFLISLSIILLFQNSVKAQKIRATDPNKPSSVILILANGMGTTALNAAMMESKTPLNITRFQVSGLIKTIDSGDVVPDDAAVMTALACGIKTNNGILGIDKEGIPVENLLEVAKRNKRFTGIVTTAPITDIVPAAFYAHENKPSFKGLIIKDLMNSDINAFIGGGKKEFKDKEDKKSLLNQLNSYDYKILEDYKDLKGKSGRKIAGLIEDQEIKAVKDKRGDYLKLAWFRTFKTLIRNDTGYFMVIDNSHINWACQANDEKYLISEILDLDKLIGEILNIISPDNKTLVILVSCYETGGLSVSNSLLDKKFNYRWTSKQHTASLTPVFATGPGSDNFTGIYDITDIFKKLKNLLE